MSDSIIGRRRLLLTSYVLGALFSLIGLLVRLGAWVLGVHAGQTSFPGAAQEWAPCFAECGVLIAAFGMGMVLLTLHHHLKGPMVESHLARGFETVPPHPRPPS